MIMRAQGQKVNRLERNLKGMRRSMRNASKIKKLGNLRRNMRKKKGDHV
jgi:hypothetical protein